MLVGVISNFICTLCNCVCAGDVVSPWFYSSAIRNEWKVGWWAATCAQFMTILVFPLTVLPIRFGCFRFCFRYDLSVWFMLINAVHPRHRAPGPVDARRLCCC